MYRTLKILCNTSLVIGYYTWNS